MSLGKKYTVEQIESFLSFAEGDGLKVLTDYIDAKMVTMRFKVISDASIDESTIKSIQGQHTALAELLRFLKEAPLKFKKVLSGEVKEEE